MTGNNKKAKDLEQIYDVFPTGRQAIIEPCYSIKEFKICHDGDQRAMRTSKSKRLTTTLHVQHLCLNISFPPLHDDDVKLPV